MSDPRFIGEAMTIAQFAKALGVPENAVKRWIVRGNTPDDLLLELRVDKHHRIRPVLSIEKYRGIMEALDFYADDGSYMTNPTKERGEEHVWRRPVLEDGGRRARVLLGEEDAWEEEE